MLGVKRNAVTLAEYSDDWEKEYTATKKEIEAILSDNAIEICHVGSTAIKGNDLKIKLAHKYPNDRVAYTEAKSEFIENIIKRAKDDNYIV